MLIDCFTQAALHNVCINLCRSEVSVTQHQLYAPQIGAPFKQMGSKSVAEDVWAQGPVDTGGFAVNT